MAFLMKLEPRHYTLLAMFLTAVAMQMQGLHAWSEALSPMFVSGVLLQLAILLKAIHTDPPAKSSDSTIDNVARFHP